MELVNEVKKIMWLFSDEQIKNTIANMQNNESLNELQKMDPEYVMLYCYKNKGTITKEEYEKNEKKYLYSISMDGKEVIDKIIDNSYYNDAVDGLITYFHAVQHARNNMMSLVRY